MRSHTADCGFRYYVHAALSVVQDRIEVVKGGLFAGIMCWQGSHSSLAGDRYLD